MTTTMMIRQPSKYLQSLMQRYSYCYDCQRHLPTNKSNLISSISSSPRRWSSSSSPSAAIPTNDDSLLYVWGTDTKGSLHGVLTTAPTTTAAAGSSTSGIPIVRGTTGETATIVTTPPPPGLPNMLDIPTPALHWKSQCVPPPLLLSSPSKDNNNNHDSMTMAVGIQQIFAGPTDTALLLTNGQLYVCGENKHGQLGVGHKQPVTRPTLLTLPQQEDHGSTNGTTTVKSISLGIHSSALITTAGELYTFGSGGSAFTGLGYLGHGSADSYLTPKLVESLVEDGCYADQVQVGEYHMTVLTTEGEVLTCGGGSYGRLGNFDTGTDRLYLEPVELLQNMPISQIVGGKAFSLALDSNEGVIYGWGHNDRGQLGTGYGLAVDMYSMSAIPTPVEGADLQGRRVRKLAAGHSHAACLTESGELFHWGMSLHLEPTLVTELQHTRIVNVACGHDYTLAVDVKGDLYALGRGKTGVLGKGSIKMLHQAEVVEALQMKHAKVKAVSAGWNHVMCLVEGGGGGGGEEQS